MTTRAFSLYVCGRERGPAGAASCSTAGCTGAVRALCDFPLGGKKAGQTCDRALCESCRRRRGDRDFCATHAAMQTTTVDVANLPRISAPRRPPCNVTARIANDRAAGRLTSARALDFVRESCPCEACATARGAR